MSAPTVQSIFFDILVIGYFRLILTLQKIFFSTSKRKLNAVKRIKTAWDTVMVDDGRAELGRTAIAGAGECVH